MWNVIVFWVDEIWTSPALNAFNKKAQKAVVWTGESINCTLQATPVLLAKMAVLKSNCFEQRFRKVEQLQATFEEFWINFLEILE